jgi:hypothetical protein
MSYVTANKKSLSNEADAFIESLSFESRKVRQLAGLITTLSERVRQDNLAGPKDQPWGRSDDSIDSALLHFFHRLYLTSEGEYQTIWGLLVMIGIPGSLAVEGMTGTLWLLWGTLSSIPGLTGLRIVVTLVAAVFLPIACYIAVGTYWVLGEALTNRGLKTRLRLLIGGISLLIAIGIIIFVLSFSLPPAVSFNDPVLDSSLNELRDQPLYRVVAAILWYIPVVLGFFLIPFRGLSMLVVRSLSVARWLVRFHRVDSAESICDFIDQPLFESGEKSRSLLDLSVCELEAIRSWAGARRDVIQGRLVPLGLLFAFLGLLANTDMAKVWLTRLFGHFRIVMSGAWAWENLGSHFLIWVLVVVLWFVMKSLVDLFNELFVADYIIQACILVSYAISSLEERSHDGESGLVNIVFDGRPRRMGWLEGIMGRKR